jgi:hypothetical protein
MSGNITLLETKKLQATETSAQPNIKPRRDEFNGQLRY